MFDVASAEARRDPVGVVGKHIGNVLEARDRTYQSRDDMDRAVVQPIDLVDQDDNVDPALVQLSGKPGLQMTQGVAAGEALPQRIETGRGGPPIAEPDVVGRRHAFAVLEHCLRQGLQLFRL